MKYAVAISGHAERQLERIPRLQRRRINAAISRLAEAPLPPSPNVKKMVGYEAMYRLRVGEYRVIYQVEHGRLRVVVIEVGSRGSVYRGY